MAVFRAQYGADCCSQVFCVCVSLRLICKVSCHCSYRLSSRRCSFRPQDMNSPTTSKGKDSTAFQWCHVIGTKYIFYFTLSHILSRMSARLCASKGLHQKILKLAGKVSLPVRTLVIALWGNNGENSRRETA